MRKLPFAILFLALCSCSPGALSYHSPGPYYGGSPLGKGTYLEEVSIEPKQGTPFRFNVIFQRKAASTLSSALSNGRKFFHVLDSYGPSPEMKFFPTDLDTQRALISEFYLASRALLILDDKPTISQPLVRERYSDQRPRVLAAAGASTTLTLDEYDWEGHIHKATVTAPTFVGHIFLREYRPEEN